jgi:NTE family protein
MYKAMFLVVTNLQGFALGGPLRLGSYGRNELPGTQYRLSRMATNVSFSALTHLGEGVYAVAFMEGGKVYENLNPVDTLESKTFDSSSFVSLPHSLGTIYIGGAADNNDYQQMVVRPRSYLLTQLLDPHIMKFERWKDLLSFFY